MNIQNTRIGEARLIMYRLSPEPYGSSSDGGTPEPKKYAADSRRDDDLPEAPTHVELDGESIPLRREAVSRIDRLREAIYRKRDVCRRAETLLQKIYEKIGEAYGRGPEEMVAHIKAGTNLRETPEAEEAYKKVEKWIELLHNFSAQNPTVLAATATQLEANIGERAQRMNDALAQNPTMTYNEDSKYVKEFEESLALHQQKVDQLENILNTYESAATLRTAADQLWESPDFRGVRGPDPNNDPWIQEQFEKWECKPFCVNGIVDMMVRG